MSSGNNKGLDEGKSIATEAPPMKGLRTVCLTLGLAVLAISVGSVSADDKRKRDEVVSARLVGFEEVPSSLSTTGRGRFRAVIDEDAGLITYRLTYEGLVAVAQAHIHFGQRHTNGGISVFLCSNLGNGPAGTQACPDTAGEVSGEIVAVNVIGPAGQGIAAGEFAELLAAIRSGNAYANVHTTAFPGGEIRGQILRN